MLALQSNARNKTIKKRFLLVHAVQVMIDHQKTSIGPRRAMEKKGKRIEAVKRRQVEGGKQQERRERGRIAAHQGHAEEFGREKGAEQSRCQSDEKGIQRR